MSDYDIITIGGGLGGAALAKAMAEKGYRVLVLERETKFRDRVRGEGLTTWGAAEARELGIYDLLVSTCGHELPWWDLYIGPMQVMHREMAATSPQGLPTLAFYHPEMQETLLAAAENAGAEVRRGTKAQNVTPGPKPSVAVESNGSHTEEHGRLIVGVDGRGSLVRKWAGFGEQRDADRLFLTGVLFDNMTNTPPDTVRLVNNLESGHAGILFPQGDGRVRSYLVTWVQEGIRLQGESDLPRYIEMCVNVGIPNDFFEGASQAGPLATFEGADCWVDHPYKNGVALIGDAAASSDPSWGQGLSLTLRDARVLRDALLANDDWDAAGHSYAAEHDRYFNVVHTVEEWMTTLFLESGPEADARRRRAMPLIMQDPTRQPDTIFTGPDHEVNDTMRRRFFGEE